MKQILHLFIRLHRVNLLSFEVGCCGLGFVNLCLRARQHVLGHQQEVGILASGDAASLLLDEHLLGDVDGQGLDGLLAGDEFLGPPGGTVLAVKYTSNSDLNDAEWIVGTATRCWEVGVRGHMDTLVEISLHRIRLGFLPPCYPWCGYASTDLLHSSCG